VFQTLPAAHEHRAIAMRFNRNSQDGLLRDSSMRTSERIIEVLSF